MAPIAARADGRAVPREVRYDALNNPANA